jgi:hypothetical protein
MNRAVRRRWTVLAVVISLVGICGGTWWLSASAADPRMYSAGDVVYGLGSLEHDILPRYGVVLPCNVTDVNYFDDESVIGPDGTLYLAFTATAACLSAVVGQYSELSRPLQVTTADDAFPAEMKVDRFGWRYDPQHTYNLYTGPLDEQDKATIIEDPAVDPFTVRMLVEHL